MHACVRTIRLENQPQNMSRNIYDFILPSCFFVFLYAENVGIQNTRSKHIKHSKEHLFIMTQTKRCTFSGKSPSSGHKTDTSTTAKQLKTTKNDMSGEVTYLSSSVRSVLAGKKSACTKYPQIVRVNRCALPSLLIMCFISSRRTQLLVKLLSSWMMRS